MKFAIILCVVLLGAADAMFDGIGDMMNKAAGTMTQMMGGENPFMKAIEQGQKMMEGGGADGLKQMLAVLEEGRVKAKNNDVQKQFEGALMKMKEMMENGSPHEQIMDAMSKMQG